MPFNPLANLLTRVAAAAYSLPLAASAAPLLAAPAAPSPGTANSNMLPRASASLPTTVSSLPTKAFASCNALNASDDSGSSASSKPATLVTVSAIENKPSPIVSAV